MGIFGNKDGIIGTALGVSGAFDKDKKTDKAAAFGVAIGASIGSGQKWTFEDSVKLGAVISALDSAKNNSANGCTSRGGSGGFSYGSNSGACDDLILSSEQEEQLEEAGIDTFEFENLMDDDGRREALEDAGLDPFDFDMF